MWTTVALRIMSVAQVAGLMLSLAVAGGEVWYLVGTVLSWLEEGVMPLPVPLICAGTDGKNVSVIHGNRV